MMKSQYGILTPRRILVGIFLGSILALGAGCASTGVQKNSGQYASDVAITSEIKAHLLEDQALQGFQIKVDTYRGHVILSGFVDGPNQIQEAVQVARNVKGVVSVRNDLVVKNLAAGS